jgi:hypothetical protein
MTDEQAVKIEDNARENKLAVAAVGLAAMLAGAILWAAVTVITHSELGLMAIAVGFMVGFAIQKFRKQPDPVFGIWGAILALAGCVLGNALSFVVFVAQQTNTPLVDAFLRVSIPGLVSVMAQNFGAMDLLFYGIAIYEGYKFSSR